MRQFNLPNASCYAGDYCQGMPNWGFPDGWGMAQIDLSSSGAYLTPAALWNWTVNVFMGLSVLQQKINDHNNYMAALRQCYGADFCDPYQHPVFASFSVHGQTVELSFPLSDIIKRYNAVYGPEVNICGRILRVNWNYDHCNDCSEETISDMWTWYPTNAFGINYVQEVLHHHDN